MKVRVSYTTQLRTSLGVSTEVIDVKPGASLAFLMSTLTDRHGDEFASVALNADGTPLPSVLLCVGDEQEINLDRELKENDEVTILSAISGG